MSVHPALSRLRMVIASIGTIDFSRHYTTLNIVHIHGMIPNHSAYERVLAVIACLFVMRLQLLLLCYRIAA
jgi:hypothetical protein